MPEFPSEPIYTEHQKMKNRRAELDAIADFLESIEAGEITYMGTRITLAFNPLMDDEGNRSHIMYPIATDIADLLAQWSGIDQNKLEQEKRRMIESCRVLNERVSN